MLFSSAQIPAELAAQLDGNAGADDVRAHHSYAKPVTGDVRAVASRKEQKAARQFMFSEKDRSDSLNWANIAEILFAEGERGIDE